MDLNVFQCVKAIKDRWEIDFFGFSKCDYMVISTHNRVFSKGEGVG